jgi:hypothetical protein
VISKLAVTLIGPTIGAAGLPVLENRAHE